MQKLPAAEAINKEGQNMEGILKVTPEKMIQSSGEFASLGSQIKNLTGEMLSLVKGMNGVWKGEASSAFGNKFESLSPDMERLYRMVQEHAQDLQEMAKQYQMAESGNAEAGGGLENSVVV